MPVVVIQETPKQKEEMHLVVQNNKFSVVTTTADKLEDIKNEFIYIGQVTADCIKTIFCFSSPELVKPHQVAARANDWGLENVPVLQTVMGQPKHQG